jgi:hypothetical protein
MSWTKFETNYESTWEDIGKPMVFYIVLVIIVVFGGDFLGGKYISCPNLGNSLQKEVKYNYWAGGCFIKLNNGNWISSNKYNGVSLED